MKSSMRRRTRVGILAVCVMGALCAAAQGASVTMTFDGPLTDVDSSVAGRFSVGDPMHASITFESTTPDDSPSQPNSGYYYPAITAFSLSVAGYNASATNGYISVFDDSGDSDPRDSFEASTETFDTDSMVPPRVGTLVGDPVNGMNLWWFRLSLHDSTATALDSDALPTSLDPARFDTLYMALQWRNISDHGTFNEGITARSFTVTSTAAAVPVPGALTLTILGAGVVGRIRRRLA